MRPLDRLHERSLPQELKRQVADSAELKGSFQPFGSTSVVTHRIFSSATYDVQFTPASVAGTLKVNTAIVEFIPDDEVFGGAFCYRMLVKALNTSNQPLAGIQPEIERLPSSDGRQRWAVHHASFGYPEDAARLKFYFFATGSGTFTASVVT